MNKLTLTSTIYRNLDVVYTQIDNDLIMMKPDEHIYYGINAIGAHVWSLLEGAPMMLSSIRENICQDYAVTETQCIADVTTFVEAMVANRLLSIA